VDKAKPNASAKLRIKSKSALFVVQSFDMTNAPDAFIMRML